MYYPKSQIKSNLYTNGEEYILSTTKEPYIGYYYEVSNGQKYTGKTPQDGPNILLTLSTPEGPFPADQSLNPLPQIYIYPNNNYSQNLSTRFLPQPNPTLPTSQDQSLGVFTRYFCKKNNELIYIEISKETHDLLKNNDPTIAWDLYTPLNILWNIKGTKEQVFKANKSNVFLLEQRQKWYGFSQYLKEDYLKYYLAS